MRDYFNFKHIKGDLFGGLTAGIVALPLALAFGVSSGMGPDAGLYGAIFIAFFAALFGGTDTQISGPTAPMTAISMVVVAGLIAANDGDFESAIPTILSVFLLAGLFQIIMGFTGVGQYIKYIPYPVVSGFMSAIGIMILITQILPAIGYYPKEDTEFVNSFKPQAEAVLLEKILHEEAGKDILVLEDFQETIQRAGAISDSLIMVEAKTLASKEASGVIGAIKMFPKAIQQINWLEFWLALGTIIIIYGFKRITTAIPSTLIALIVMTSIAVGFSLNYQTISEIPTGLPIPHWEVFKEFSWAGIQPYIFTALTLSLLGAIDSLLTSVVADNVTKTKHNPNKELVGQGIGNSIASIFGGIPGAGATIRTIVNINAGGKTRLSGMIAGVLLLMILLTLGPVASKIPAAVLAGILVTVGIGVMDYKGLKAIPKMPKSEVLIMIVVLILASVWDLVYAVGIGLVLASLVFMKQIGDLTTRHSNISTLDQEPIWADEQNFPASFKENVFIKHVNGPLFFGSTSEFQILAKQIPKEACIVIIRTSKMTYIDQSGLYAMEDVLIELSRNNIQILFVGLNKYPKLMLESIDIIPDLVPEENVFENVSDSLTWIRSNFLMEIKSS
ncbi:SulP family inorganic anion transporter [Crocinitomix catalasitica]|uniref:SulP family inorganic anion transporter n=1 Tax=Crocinitomix catalasitica TaxID=184607 RepID=UPI0004874C18|nr:SulP family inorganic anion transporter [Crocinitomix catalasitica]